jgi:outer membrane protein
MFERLNLLPQAGLSILIAFGISFHSMAQSSDSTMQAASLDKVIQYTLDHQPAIQQARIDEDITEKTIKGKIADWFPQVNFAYTYQRVIDLQYTVFNGEAIPIGVFNTSAAQLTATQTLFNRDVLLASSTASKVRILADQNTSRTRIDATVNVTKAFYDVLATRQQIGVNEESIRRLKKSLKDAYNRYASGVADKTDYKRASILLANAEVALKSTSEVLQFKEQYLKTLMGYPTKSQLNLVYDTLQMEKEIDLDTLQEINLSYHIDYKLLTTQRELQHANVKYSYWGLLPSLNAYGAYNLNFQNNDLSKLYDRRFPYSYVGATLTIPIFQGGKRLAKIQEQRYAEKRLEVGLTNLQSQLQTEYTRALASYKSNLKNYRAQSENVALANEVYDVIQLQYLNGVRSYLDVTIAESDLRTTRINYFNALYQVLAAKMDVLKALGQISN